MPDLLPLQSGRASAWQRAVLLAALLLPAACERRGLTDNGVIGSFGDTGLGWGDFSYPRAIASSADSHIFVADKSGRIQRFDASGRFEAGWWMQEWTYGKPIGMTVHPDGRLFVADTHYHRVMIYDADGHLLDRFGGGGDGPGQFRLVTDVAVDAEGFIYVGEYGGNDRISKFAPDLTFLKHLGAEPIAGARLSRPAALVVDGDTLWIADACNHRIVHLTLDGRFLTSFGSVGTQPGQMRWPYGIDLCRDGTLLVSEFGNHRLQWFDRSGKSVKTWGGSGRQLGTLYSPWGVDEAPNGNIYVLDSLNNRVQIIRG